MQTAPASSSRKSSLLDQLSCSLSSRVLLFLSREKLSKFLCGDLLRRPHEVAPAARGGVKGGSDLQLKLF